MGVRKFSPIIERIWSDVENAHDLGGGKVYKLAFTIEGVQFFKLIYLSEIYAKSYTILCRILQNNITV